MKMLMQRAGLPRWIFFRNELDRVLAMSVLFSIGLCITSVLITGQRASLFLIWNLFLAYVPYAISGWLKDRPQFAANIWVLGVVFIEWLVFIPNSFYIITDLFHIGRFNSLPRGIELILLLSFAWNGLLLGVLSVRQMEKIMIARFGLKQEWLFVYPIMWLNALGVYIGRDLRYNSWDVITNPFALLSDIFEMMVHPLQYRTAWSMVVCFSIFMTLIYVTLKRISKAIH